MPRAPLVFYSTHDLGSATGAGSATGSGSAAGDARHALGGDHTGVAGNAPEARKRLVLRELERRLTKEAFRATTRAEASLVKLGGVVHDPDMITFLEQAWTTWSAEWIGAKSKPGGGDHLRGVFALVDPSSGWTPADDASGRVPPLVAGFSAPRHDWVQRAPLGNVYSQACYFAMDRETPIHESTARALRWDLAVMRDAAESLVAQTTKLAYAQITHPGHHSGPSSYGGFCFINQAAVGVRLLQRRFPRVAVVDVDYHAGNGTMAVFWTDASVFFASLHADPAHDYPFNAGFADQVGPAPPHPAHGTTMNVPLPAGTTWAEYRRALARVVQRVRDFRADALVVSLGVDTLRGDPVAWPDARFALDPDDYAEMGKMLIEDLALPTLVVQEGGYFLEKVPLAVANFLTGAASAKAGARL